MINISCSALSKVKPFAKGEFREFTFDGFKEWHGDRFIMLRDKATGESTLPGFEEDGWRFRVRCEKFQDDWNDDEAWPEYTCLVTSMKRDSDGSETDFPLLRQEFGFILGRLYPADESKVARDFEVIGVPGDLDPRFAHGGKLLSHYLVQDEKQFPVNCPKPAMALLAAGRTIAVGDHVRAYAVVAEKGLYFEPVEAAVPVAASVPAANAAGLASLETYKANAIGETMKVEYKSSLVYPAAADGGASEMDIKEQIGWELMLTLAGFMNAQGGELLIGVKNDGNVVGIEGDLNHMTLEMEDESVRSYPADNDGFQRCVIDTMQARLGRSATALVESCKLMQCEGHLVGYVRVRPSRADIPVYLRGKYLFVRVASSTRRMKGEDAARFVIERSRRLDSERSAASAKPSQVVNVAESEVQRAHGTDVSGECQKKLVEAIVKTAKANNDRVVSHITIFSDGTAMRTSRAESGEGILASVPVLSSQMKKSGRLLLCYANGRVNVLCPKDVLSKKLAKRNHRYSNALCKDSPLVAMLVGCADDLLSLTTECNGEKFAKLVSIDDYATHDPMSMATKGNMVIKIESMQGAAVTAAKLVDSRNSAALGAISRKADHGAGTKVS